MAGQGKALEQALGRMHQSYRTMGQAWVVKAHPEARTIGRRKIIYAEVGPPDFMGIIAGGRPVCLEAKETLAVPNRFRYQKLHEHQAEDLDACQRMGGLSLLVIAFTPTDVALLRWRRVGEDWWRWHRDGGSPASISRSDERLEWLRGVDWLRVVSPDGR